MSRYQNMEQLDNLLSLGEKGGFAMHEMTSESGEKSAFAITYVKGREIKARNEDGYPKISEGCTASNKMSISYLTGDENIAYFKERFAEQGLGEANLSALEINDRLEAALQMGDRGLGVMVPMDEPIPQHLQEMPERMIERNQYERRAAIANNFLKDVEVERSLDKSTQIEIEPVSEMEI